MQDSTDALTTLVVRRTLAASPGAVFRAWTDPVFVSQWSWGSEHETLALELDCRVNGSWKQEIRNRKTGERWSFDGGFQEVVPDRRLVHTFFWRSDKGVEEGPSLVAIDFLGQGEDRTEVVIAHSRLAAPSRDGTQSGWEDVLIQVEASVFSSSRNATSGS
jgi:uncharacterized protein YndB with AHSA1/START domain